MTYGKCPALSQSIGETAGLKLSAGKGLSIPPAVIGPSGWDHCLRGRNHPCPWGIKSVPPLRQIRVSTNVCLQSQGMDTRPYLGVRHRNTGIHLGLCSRNYELVPEARSDICAHKNLHI